MLTARQACRKVRGALIALRAAQEELKRCRDRFNTAVQEAAERGNLPLGLMRRKGVDR